MGDKDIPPDPKFEPSGILCWFLPVAYNFGPQKLNGILLGMYGLEESVQTEILCGIASSHASKLSDVQNEACVTNTVHSRANFHPRISRELLIAHGIVDEITNLGFYVTNVRSPRCLHMRRFLQITAGI
jgi:hypothetical protein